MSDTSDPLYQCLPIPAGDRFDLAALQAIRMVLLHNVMIRGINSMISYAPEVKTGDIPTFLKYCDLFDQYVRHHHANEEEVYFDMLEAKMGAGSMKGNLDGHQAFKAPYEAWTKMRQGVSTEIGTWNPTWHEDEFIAGIRAFAGPLIEHLQEEINTLHVNVFKEKFTEAELTNIEKVMEARVKKEMSLVWDLPFFFVNGDGVNGKWFPPAPAPIIFVARSILFKLHPDIWRYGCADKNMKIKERFAAYEPVAAA